MIFLLILAQASSVLADNFKSYSPKFAIDGKISHDSKNFFHSKDEMFPWLEVKLPSTTMISSVTIVNRKDCCGDRFRNVEVRAGLDQVPAGFYGQQIDVNSVCAAYPVNRR